MSWLDRLTGGFKKTADRLGENISGLASKVALDTATLDDIEEALIASDLARQPAQIFAQPVGSFLEAAGQAVEPTHSIVPFTRLPSRAVMVAS